MPIYRIYLIADDGRIFDPPTRVDCENDEAAVAVASCYATSRDIEIWESSRRVIRFAPGR